MPGLGGGGGGGEANVGNARILGPFEPPSPLYRSSDRPHDRRYDQLHYQPHDVLDQNCDMRAVSNCCNV